MYRILSLLLFVSVALSASAIDESKTIRPVDKTGHISFQKPQAQFSQDVLPKTDISASPTADFTTSSTSAARARKSPMKVVKDENGVYQVTADHFAYVERFEGGWFMSFFSDAHEDDDYFMFKFHFKNGSTSSPAVHLTSTDQLLRLCYGHTESAQLDTIRYEKIDLTVTEDEDGALKMEGDVWGKVVKHDDYGKVTSEGEVQQYHYLITQAAPIKPKEEKNLEITCDPQDCYLYSSESVFFGKDEATGLWAQVAVRGMTGEFDKDHIMTDYTLVCEDNKGTNAVGIAEQQSATVTLKDNKDFDVNASFVGTDSIRYNIHMTMTLPDGGEPIDVKITNAQAQSFWGYFMTQGYNETYDAQVSGVMKTGPVEDFSTLSAAVAYDVDGQQTAGYALFFHDAEISTDENDQLIVTCSFYANDYKEYRLDMRYVVGEVKDTISVACDDCEYINALEKEQAQRIQGDSNDGRYTVQITMLGTDSTEGTYDLNDSSNAWGYVYDNETQRQMYFLNGTAVVTMDENKHIVCRISADGMDIDVHHFDITMQTEWDSEYMEKKEYDAEEGELNAAFSSADDVTMENYINNGGYLYINIRSNERKELLTMVVYAPKQDRKIFIPVGTYTIEDTEELYTIQPSPGVSDGVIYPSYYATLSDDGYLTTPIWMFEKGTMTVENVDNNLVFTIDAINSYKRPIHITYNVDVSAIKNITTERTPKSKRFENGRVVICTGQKKYNAAGARLK